MSKFIRLILFTLVLIFIGSFLVFQSTKVVEVEFKEGYTKEELEKLNNKKITLNGFLSPVMDEKGIIGYLLKEPFNGGEELDKEMLFTLNKGIAIINNSTEILYRSGELKATGKFILATENNYDYAMVMLKIDTGDWITKFIAKEEFQIESLYGIANVRLLYVFADEFGNYYDCKIINAVIR